MILLLAGCIDGSETLDYSSASLGGTWTEPQRLDAVEHNANNPVVGIDGDGNGLVAWRQQVAYPAKIFVTHFDRASGAWSAPQKLESGGRVIAGPHLAISPAGHAVLVWEQRVTDPQRIWSSHYTPSSATWTAPQALNTGTDLARTPRIASDDAGNAIAVWSANPQGSPASILARRLVASTGTWSAAQPLETATGNALEPDVAMNGSGVAIAVWTQTVGSDRRVVVNRFDPVAGQWGTAQLLTGAGAPLGPRVAIDAQGRALAIWQARAASTSSLMFSRFVNGSWSPGQQVPGSDGALIGSSGVPHSLAPDLAMCPDGSALLVWSQRKTSTVSLTVYGSRFSAATSQWSVGPKRLEETTGQASTPRVAIDSHGNGVAVWEHVIDRRFNIFANTFDVTTFNWTGAQPLDQSPQTAFAPDVALDDSGRAIAVWSQFGATWVQTWASQLGP